MNKKYAFVKADNSDLKIENKMYMKENSRLNKIIMAQKQVLLSICTIYTSIYIYIMYYFQIFNISLINIITLIIK